MQTIILPEQFLITGTGGFTGLLFHPYISHEEIFRAKGVLKTNAFSMVIHGQKTMRFAEQKVQINEGEFHLLSAGNCLSSVEFKKDRIFETILIFFDHAHLESFFNKNAGACSFVRAENKTKAVEYLSFKKDPFIHAYQASLQALLSAKMPISDAMAQLKFEELMLYMVQKYPAQMSSFQGLQYHDKHSINLRALVAEHYKEGTTLQEIAFLCNLSLSSFKRKFIEQYGVSPHAWLLRQRLLKAYNLLLTQQAKPSEVFYQVGYDNHSSFSKAFRQFFGFSPKESCAQKMNIPEY